MTLKQFTETDQQAIAEGIARALDLEGLLVQTINGSDRPRQQSAELIARQLRDLFTLANYFVATCERLNDALTDTSVKLIAASCARERKDAR